MKVILLSGAPGAGKDTVANLLGLKYHGNIYHTAFAQPLKAGIGAVLGVDHPNELELLKRSDPRIRKLLIGLSEDVMKPIMGMEWFATAAAERMFSNNVANFERAVVTDCGFQHEVDAFIERLRQYYGEDTRFINWCITRPGHNYLGDSRSPIHLDPEQGENISIYNFGGVEDLKSNVNIYSTGFWGEADR